MKAIITFFLIALFSLPVFSADNTFDNGSYMVGGNISYSKSGGDLFSDETNLFFNPQVSYCLGDGLFFGGMINVHYYKYSIDYYYSESKYSNTQTTFGIMIDKYFPSSSGQVKGKFIPHFGAGTTFSKEAGYTFLTFEGSAGAIYMISASAGIEFGFNYIYYDYEDYSGYNYVIGMGMNYFIF